MRANLKRPEFLTVEDTPLLAARSFNFAKNLAIKSGSRAEAQDRNFIVEQKLFLPYKKEGLSVNILAKEYR